MVNKSCLFAREPLWREHKRGVQHCLPENIKSWVYEPGSLTQRLRDYYGNKVAVTVLAQYWHMPFLSESRQLRLSAHRYVLIREVLMHANGKPLLLARTTIPQKTIKVAHRNLAHLGNRPLGEVIFSYPDLERVAMDITHIQPDAWTPQILSMVDMNPPAWGRRTVYAIQQRTMLVSEFFLDEILSH